MQKHPSVFRNLSMVLIGIFTLGLVGCSTSQEEPRSSAVAVADKAPESMSNGEILYVMQTINMGEIEQAELALQHSQSREVTEVAELMLEEHVASNQMLGELAEMTGANLESSSVSEGVAFQARAFRTDIAGLAGEEFNQAYLQKQIELHGVAKNIVKTQLLPNAKDPQVREYLTQYLERLEMHQQRAQQAFKNIL